MKRLNWFQKSIIFFIVLVIFRNAIFFKFEVAGTYVSNAETLVLELPEKGTILKLNYNGTYTSNSFMGHGEFKIRGNLLMLSNGMSGWNLTLERRYNFGQPMILMDPDQGYYFIRQ